jgi:hypothetical protein
MTIRGLGPSFERYSNCVTAFVLLMTNHCESSVSEGRLHYKESFMLAVNTMSYWPTQSRTQKRHWVILCRFVVQVLLMEHVSFELRMF